MRPTTVTTTLTHHRPAEASEHGRPHNHVSAPSRASVNARSSAIDLTKPSNVHTHFHPTSSHSNSAPPQYVPPRDFHLDTFFNPVWMSGAHVFSFAEDGTVVPPSTYQAEPYPGYHASAPSSRRIVHGSSARFGSAVRARADARATSSSSGPSRLPPPSRLAQTSSSASAPTPTRPPPLFVIRRPTTIAESSLPWKNVAISEQDDAEFAAMQEEAEIRAEVEAKSKLVGFARPWPSESWAAPCQECEVLVMAEPRRKEVFGAERPSEGMVAGKYKWTGVGAAIETDARASPVPALSYGSSGESESESEIFTVVPGRRAVGHGKEGLTEKSVGFRRAERKPPPPSVSRESAKADDDSVSWSFLFDVPILLDSAACIVDSI